MTLKYVNALKRLKKYLFENSKRDIKYIYFLNFQLRLTLVRCLKPSKNQIKMT